MSHPAAPTDPAAAPRSSGTRFLLVALVALILVGAGAFFFGPGLLLSYYINGLNSDDPVVRKEMEKKLTESQAEGVDEKLRAALRDDDRTFRLRDACARILYQRQRLGDLEGILRDGSLGARAATISALAEKGHFVADYVEDAGWRVKETLKDWIRDPRDRARSRAVQIALMPGVALGEEMPEIRKMLTRRPDGDLPPAEQRDQILAALGAAVQFKDCESVPALVGLVAGDAEEIVRLRSLQAVFLLTGAGGAACPDAFPAERLKAMVLAALSDGSKIVRMGAITDLEKHQPAWMAELRPRLVEILDGEGSPAERRGALSVLALAKDETIRERLPRYFHDRAKDVRSTAVSASQVFLDPATARSGFEACLVGMVRLETESDVAFENAVQALKKSARDWVGLPPDVRRDAAARGPAFRDFLATLYGKGESRGVTREGWAKEWFRWLCGQLALTTEESDQAVATQDAFWRAARGGDLAGAKAALAAYPRRVPGLFCAEEGWLAARVP